MIDTRLRIVFIGVILILGYLLISPALSGGFYYDDQINLHQLGTNGGIKSFSDWLFYVFSGTSGPLGRPISLATFTINAQTWPTSPYYFKLTNLLIHLFNGLLVYFFIDKLLTIALGYLNDKKRFFISLLSMSLWLYHPLQLSSILPVIQRMTELSTMFTLLGLIYYLSRREQIFEQPIYKLITYSVVIVLFGLLAALSKENGILLPVYLLCIESCFFLTTKKTKVFIYWKTIMLYIPLVIIFSYLIYQLFIPAPNFREFTNWQRFISQPPILVEYLILFFIPQVHVSGIFTDSHPFYHSLLEKNSLLYLIAVCTLIITSFILKSRLKILSFGVLWFFSGHLLESSTIPLELYFEHRNYLPILGFILTFGYYLNNIRSTIIKSAIATSSIILYAFICYQNSQLWSDPLKHSVAALIETPLSARANETAAQKFLELNKVAQAKKHYKNLRKIYPQESVYLFQSLYASCLLKHDNKEEYKFLSQELKKTSSFKNTAMVANQISLKIEKTGCHYVSQEHLLELLNILEQQLTLNRKLTSAHLIVELENIFLVKANIFLRQNETAFAITHFDKALQLNPSYDIAFSLVNLYLSIGKQKKAEELIRQMLKYKKQKGLLSNHNPQEKKFSLLLEAMERKKNDEENRCNSSHSCQK